MDNIFSSLVRIQSQGYQFNWLEPFKPLEESVGVGTGFFINSKGYILTCAHVINNSSKIWVSVPSNGLDKYDAEIVSFYPEQDMAIIKIINYKKDINYLKVGDSDKIIPGEDVIAVGYPLGQDKLKITKGIISGRESGLIQTDTPLNPGNSGGPLLDKSYKVLGINSSAYKAEDAENVGFAIPINTAKRVIPSLISKKYYEHSLLGIAATEKLSYERKKQLNIEEEILGIEVTYVDSEGPSGESGLIGRNGNDPGDIIVKIMKDELEFNVNSFSGLVNFLNENTVPGDTIELTVIRDNENLNLNIKLGFRPLIN